MRFAILTHDHPFPHWDLLLEAGSFCRTWRLLSAPDAPGMIAAEAIADHRRAYLDYEGPVSGGRGSVTQWDAGDLVWLSCRGIQTTALVRGRRWNGRLTIRSTLARPDVVDVILDQGPDWFHSNVTATAVHSKRWDI